MDKIEARRRITALIGRRYAFSLDLTTDAGGAVAVVTIARAPGSVAAREHGDSSVIARATLPRRRRKAWDWTRITFAVEAWADLAPDDGNVSFVSFTDGACRVVRRP